MVADHITSGMYGMMIVEPRGGYATKVDREDSVAQSEFVLAEPEGFEPSMQVLPTYSLSRGAPSATRSQLRWARF